MPEIDREFHKNDNGRLEKAIYFATQCHSGQVRKGSSLPYILHPLEVMQILVSMEADTNLLIAGLLHDVIEDAGVTRGEIEEQFGTDVADLVAAHSEDKSKSWQGRKQTTIDELKSASYRVKMLVMADKVANLRSMVMDEKKLGEQLWERFRAPKEKQAWYYKGVRDELGDMQSDNRTLAVYLEMNELIEMIFEK